jgi:hypothetical protein
MESDPFRTWALLAKCGGGLALFALIAFAKFNMPISTTAEAIRSPAVSAVGSQRNMRAESHRKEVFEERRARFAQLGDQSRLGSKTLAPAEQLSAHLR